MLDFTAVRARLAEIATEALPEDSKAKVYDYVPQTLTGLVSVVVGQPRITGFDTQPAIDTVDWAVAVVVSPGSTGNFNQAQRELEALWPVLAEAFREATEQDQSLGAESVAGSDMDRAEFGEFSISGQMHPAQSIHLTLYG